MTEYEVADLLASITANMYLDGAAFTSLFSAYILMSYFTGDKLTRFQVSFINFVFIALVATANLGILSLLVQNIYWRGELSAINPSHDSIATFSRTTVYVYLTFRVLVVAGCLVFMWQVRRGSNVKATT